MSKAKPSNLIGSHQDYTRQESLDSASMGALIDAPNLAVFQQQFGQYLRAQSQGDLHKVMSLKPSQPTVSSTPKPSEVISTRVATLYQSLVFNNICSFLNQCFPVCQTLVSTEHWLTICEQFFLHHGCHSPYFTEINQSFVGFLAEPNQSQALQVPLYFAELAHYEWVELLVETHVDMALDADDAMTTQLRLNSTLQNLHYQWPVHAIGVESRPDTPEDSFFLVYRNHEDRVEFMKTNALTYALIDFIKTQDSIAATIPAMTDLLTRFAAMLGQDNTDNNTDVLVSFGLPLLVQLSEKQVLFPSLKV